MVLAIPGLTPAAYWELSHEETLALAQALNQRAEKQRR